MYCLPRDFNSDQFVGKSLRQVCVSENTITFFFGEWPDPYFPNIHVVHGVAIRDLKRRREATIILDDGVRTNELLGDAVGGLVVGTDVLENKTIRMSFDNGIVLDVLGDSESYECYEVALDRNRDVIRV